MNAKRKQLEHCSPISPILVERESNLSHCHNFVINTPFYHSILFLCCFISFFIFLLIRNWQLSPSSQKLLYCTGLMKADIITWHRIFDEYMSTKEETLLEYLACTDNEVIVMYYLQKLANSKILEYKSLQRTYISIAKKHAKSDAVLQFLISNLMKLTTK